MKLNVHYKIVFNYHIKHNLFKWKSNIICNTIHKEHNYKLINKYDIYKKVCDLIDKKI